MSARQCQMTQGGAGVWNALVNVTRVSAVVPLWSNCPPARHRHGPNPLCCKQQGGFTRTEHEAARRVSLQFTGHRGPSHATAPPTNSETPYAAMPNKLIMCVCAQDTHKVLALRARRSPSAFEYNFPKTRTAKRTSMCKLSYWISIAMLCIRR